MSLTAHPTGWTDKLREEACRVKKFILSLSLLFALLSLPAFGAPLMDADAKDLLVEILPKAVKIFYIWHGGINFAENTNIRQDGIQGEYVMLNRSFPYKTVRAIVTASREVYSKRAYEGYLQGAVPTYKEADGRIWAAAGTYDGQLSLRWLTKNASIAWQSQDKIIVKCLYEKEFGGAAKTGYLDFVKEDGKWKLDSHIDIPRGAPGVKDRDVWYGEDYKETADYLFHVAPMLGDENRPELLASYVCLGFWDTRDYSKPTPYIQDFTTRRLTEDPGYFLEGTKIFVVIPRYKDSKITVELIDHPGHKPLYTGAPGKTLVFAGNTPTKTKSQTPIYQITIKHGSEIVTFIPDISSRTERPTVKPDKRLLDLTPPKAAG